MLKQFSLYPIQLLPDSWYLDLPPSRITVCSVQTGRQVQDLSLVAVDRAQPDRLRAVGKDALPYKNDPNFAVFSPFRRGQITQFPAAQLLLKELLHQAGVKPPMLPKPVMCVHIQEHTTQVEEQALAEAAIQAGARKVFFYTDPLSVMLDCARSRKDLRHAVILHIDPQEG